MLTQDRRMQTYCGRRQSVICIAVILEISHRDSTDSCAPCAALDNAARDKFQRRSTHLLLKGIFFEIIDAWVELLTLSCHLIMENNLWH
jgi:hypothetical protein